MNSNVNNGACLHFSVELTLEKKSTIQYSIPVKAGRRKKSIALKFEGNQPCIDVPKHLSSKEVLRLLRLNESWLKKALFKWQKNNPLLEGGACMNDVVPKAKLPFGDDCYRLVQSSQNSVTPGQANQPAHADYLSRILWQGDWLPVYSTGRAKDSDLKRNVYQGFQLDDKDWRRFRKSLSQTNTFQVLLKTLHFDSTRLLQGCQNWTRQQFWTKQWRIFLCDSQMSATEFLAPEHWFSTSSSLKDPRFIVEYVGAQWQDLIDFLLDQDLTLALRIQIEELINWIVNWVLANIMGRAYQTALEHYLPIILPKWADKMGLAYRDYEVKSYKSRWGSCKSNGSLQFNWRICQAPLKVIDSLVIHELAHIKHPNHSRAFWNLVRQFDRNLLESESQFKTDGRNWIEFLAIAYR